MRSSGPEGIGPERAALCIFVKEPRPGQVKTRLAADLGSDEAAAALARAFFDDTLAAARARADLRLVVAVDGQPGPVPRGIAVPSDHPDFAVWPQGQGDLGLRLETVLRRALEGAPSAIAIGADTPGLPPALIDAALAALAESEAVIGPAADGGFYLLGLRGCPAGLLADLPWSAADTCARTLERLRTHWPRTAVLDPWFDVDRRADLERLRAFIDRGEVVAPVTARALQRLVPRISVVIPVLDEEARLGLRLDELAGLADVAEVIVVDGGSRDRTLAIARTHEGVRVLEAPRGRGSQMNAGAAAATGEVLWFLHADTAPPVEACALIAGALADPAVVAGAFKTWTICDAGPSWIAPLLHLADIRSRCTRLPYGDQAVFVRREAFRRAGGFAPQPMFEDIALARRLRRLGRIVTVPARVRVSGRRFLRHPLRATLAMHLFPVLHGLGVSAERLARLYAPIR